MDTATKEYPGFGYPPSSLSAFSSCMKTFVIALRNGKIIIYKPDNFDHFKAWLDHHRIRDIDVDSGLPDDLEL